MLNLNFNLNERTTPKLVALLMKKPTTFICAVSAVASLIIYLVFLNNDSATGKVIKPEVKLLYKSSEKQESISNQSANITTGDITTGDNSKVEIINYSNSSGM